jgi:hypothetical protein
VSEDFGQVAADGVADLALGFHAGGLNVEIGGEGLEGGHFSP